MMSLILRGGILRTLDHVSAVNIFLYKNPAVEQVVLNVNNLHFIPLGRPSESDMAIESRRLKETVVLTVNNELVYGQPKIFQYQVILNVKRLQRLDFSHAELFKYYETKWKWSSDKGVQF